MNFHQEIEWSKKLVALPTGTVIRWIDAQPFNEAKYKIVRGECLLVSGIHMPIARRWDGTDATKVYEIYKCTAKNFKPMKTNFSLYVDSVARWLLEGKVEILREVK